MYAVAAPWLASRLFEVKPFDPITLGILISTLLAAVVVATWRPVRVAVRTDPALTLRSE
jgi:hypothetical protein